MLSAERRRPLLRDVLVFCAFVLLTVAMTWPWAAHLRDALSDPGDPYLNSWTLWWDFHQTFHDPLHLFAGNIFYPYRYSLAFSENNYGIALPFFPLLAVGVRPLTVHGLAVLLGFALSGFGAFRLARTLTGSTGAAWVAGIGFAFVPYRFHHLSHVNYVSAGWMALLLEALVLFVRERSRKRATWLGAAILMNGLACIHWAVLSLVPLALAGAFLVVWNGVARDPALFRRGAIALGLAGLGLAPFLVPYRRAAELYGFVRNPTEAAFCSARLVHWVTPEPRNRLWGGAFGLSPDGELCLFPGALLLGLAFTGVLLTRRRNVEAAGTGLIWALGGFLGSLGMNAPFHRFLFEWIPLFRSIRVPARWAMVADLGLALLAAVGAASLAERVAKRRTADAVAAVLCLALLLELRSAPLDLARGDPDPDELTLFLAKTPMAGGLVELPAGGTRGNYRYVLRAADHGKPLVTAVSGFVPPIEREIEDLTRRSLVPDRLLDLLESIPASYLAVHEASLEPGERDRLHVFLVKGLDSGRLRFVRRFGGRARDDLYAVSKIEPAVASLETLPWTVSAVPATVDASGREDATLPGALDAPFARAIVRGPLVVLGWARSESEDLDATLLIDGEERKPDSFRRIPRPDVRDAVPRLGDCSRAGYEVIYSFLPGDDGTHEIRLLLRAKDGRVRHWPMRRFEWRPER